MKRLNITYDGHNIDMTIDEEGSSDPQILAIAQETVRSGYGTMPASPGAVLEGFKVQHTAEAIIVRPAVPFG